MPTEEIAIDFSGPGSAVIKGGSSSKLSAPKSSGKISSGKLSASDASKNLANPGGGDSSEFELSLDADSDDFELKLNTEASDEVALGAVPKEPSSSGKRSGRKRDQPSRPGRQRHLARKGQASRQARGAQARQRLGRGLRTDPRLVLGRLRHQAQPVEGEAGPRSDSEFELTLDDSGGSSIEHAALAPEEEAEKGDIFETDFEIPPMEAADSGSEAVALESDTDLEKSDVDVVEDASGSEVVLLEDEGEAPTTKAKGRKAADADVDLADVEEEEDASVSKALKGVKGRRRDEEDEEEAAVRAGAARPVAWGRLPGIFLVLAFPLMLVGGMMAYELLETTWGYQQPRKPAAPLVGNLRRRSTWSFATSKRRFSPGKAHPARVGFFRRRGASVVAGHTPAALSFGLPPLSASRRRCDPLVGLVAFRGRVPRARRGSSRPASSDNPRGSAPGRGTSETG